MNAKHIDILAKKFRAWKSRRTMKRGFDRRGSALILTLVLTLSLASLATSAIYLGANDQMLALTYDQERNMRYAAEAVLAMGKSTLNFDPLAAPSTGLILHNRYHTHETTELAGVGAGGPDIHAGRQSWKWLSVRVNDRSVIQHRRITGARRG